ncbi:MAG: glycosyltransferase [Crocinitomicaceae bacterium]|nr:glycosyltransferase [Crocinitomicaceae bacterium]
MKLLILTQYFPPETGAPQNRLFELAMRLQDMGMHVEVLTAMPNYPKAEIFEGYKGKKYVKENLQGLTVHRTSIYVSRSRGIRPRLVNYFSFVRSSYRFGKKLADFDFILCESPPLFLGYSAMWLSKRLNAKLIFNVSDLWPESAEKLGLVTNWFFLKLAYRLEAKCYRRSYLITGQTQGIVEDIRRRFPEKDVYWLPNGVNLIKYDPQTVKSFDLREKYAIRKDELIFFYGGILGHAQGLDLIIKVAKRLEEKPVKFVLMGSGPVKAELMELSRELGSTNVIFAEPVSREDIMGVIADIDISVIPLRKIDLFLGAIPSKIFEALAMEKPILLGVDGEAKSLFIDQGQAGWFFEPEDEVDLEQKIVSIIGDKTAILQKGKNGRAYVAKHFNRNGIAEAFYNYLFYRYDTVKLDAVPAAGKSSVSIIIPCRNEEKFIARNIESILEQDYPGKLEVLVVDGLSTDNTRQIVSDYCQRFPGRVKLVDNQMQYTPNALNIGIESSTSDVFIILGGHAYLERSFVRLNVERLEADPLLGCAGGLINGIFENSTGYLISKGMSSVFGVGNATFRLGGGRSFVDTVAFGAYKRDVYEKIGGFDENLVRNQDDDYNYRVLKAGYKILFDPEIVSNYYVRSSFALLRRQYNQYGYWKVYVNKKHKRVTTVRQMFPALFILGIIVGCALSLAHISFLIITAAFVALYVLLGFYFAFKLADRSTQVFVLFRIFLILHFSYGFGYLKGIIDFLILNKMPVNKSKEMSRH